MACSPASQPPCPAGHLRAPRLRSAGAVPATATQSLARLDMGGHPRDDLGWHKPPQRGKSLRPGPAVEAVDAEQTETTENPV